MIILAAVSDYSGVSPTAFSDKWAQSLFCQNGERIGTSEADELGQNDH
jgi:hypothetical protein